MIPKQVFFTKGVGVHKDKLQSFEMALRQAGIATCNLVHVSSILPPNCKIISPKSGTSKIEPGQITYCVMARNSTNEPNRLLAAAVGLAYPTDHSTYGYLSEHHSFGEKKQVAGDYAEDLAATMLATTLGIPFDPDTCWEEREQVYRMSGKIIESRSVTQTARGDKTGKWTSVLAAAVFITE
ncbi:MAG: arginine decarboxylase, pyruvoyl-dependent [bacterium]